jgi:hypothetical protein
MQCGAHVMRWEENLLSVLIRNVSIDELYCSRLCRANFRPDGTAGAASPLNRAE